MSDRAGRRLAGCSHGMRQRIKLAQALINDPPILLLDEPLSGIDPGGRREISRLLLAQGEKGKTILISSHILGETESLTDSVLIIARGRIVASGTLAEIRGLLEDRPLSVEIGSLQARQMRLDPDYGPGSARYRAAWREPGDSDAESGTVFYDHQRSGRAARL